MKCGRPHNAANVQTWIQCYLLRSLPHWARVVILFAARSLSLGKGLHPVCSTVFLTRQRSVSCRPHFFLAMQPSCPHATFPLLLTGCSSYLSFQLLSFRPLPYINQTSHRTAQMCLWTFHPICLCSILGRGAQAAETFIVKFYGVAYTAIFSNQAISLTDAGFLSKILAASTPTLNVRARPWSRRQYACKLG